MSPSRHCPQGHVLQEADTECPVCRTVILTDLQVPTDKPPVFPGYDVVARLGAGGMGEVFRVRNLRLQRDEAVKRIRTRAFVRTEEKLQFRREAEAIARIKHPHIVPIHQVGEIDGDPFYAMEFVEGGSLALRLRKGPLPISEAAALVEKLAGALNAAHQQRVVHLDLKPENVLLTEAGEPKIADFGLTRPFGENEDRPVSWIGGTPGYMAPEQFRPEGALVGPGADIFGLGATLFHLLTGRPPFLMQGAGAEEGHTVREWRHALEAAYERPLPPMRSLRPEVPLDLEAICLRCLQPDPARRYPSAAALADDLQRFRTGHAVAARPVGLPTRLGKWCRRNVAAALLAAGMIAAVVAGFAGVVWQWRETIAERDATGREYRRAEGLAEVERLRTIEAEKARAAAERALAEEKRANYTRSILLADKEYWADHVLGCLRTLEECPPDLRRWEWHFLKNRCHPEKLELVGHADHVNAVAFLPDGKRLLSASNDGTARVWDLASGKEITRFAAHGSDVLSAAPHPSLPEVVLTGGRDRRVRYWNPATGKEVRPPLEYPAHVQAVAACPAAKLFAFAGSRTKEPAAIVVWDAVLDRPVRVLSGEHRAWIGRLAFSPDGRWLASSDGEGLVLVWDAADWTVKERFQGMRTATVTPGIAFSPDGNWFGWTELDTGIQVWPTDRPGTEARVIGRDDAVSYAIAFSPTVKEMVTGGSNGVLRTWRFDLLHKFHLAGRYLEKLPTLKFPALRGHTGSVAALDFSPDGTLLASGSDDRTIRIWDVGISFRPEIWRGEEGSSSHLAVSRNGHRLLRLSYETGSDLITLKDGKITVHGIDSNGVFRRSLPAVSRCADFLDPAGERVLIGHDDGRLSLWRPGKDQDEPLAFGMRRVSALAVAPDGKRFAAGEGGIGFAGMRGREEPGRIFLGSADDPRQPARILKGHDQGVSGLAFSPDGSRLASVGHDKLLRIWDTATGEEQFRSDPLSEACMDVAWSPDGRWLATVQLDHLGFRWDMTTSPPGRRDLAPLGAIPTRVRFTPDGRRLLIGFVGHLQADLKLYDLDTGLDLLTIPAAHTSTWGLGFHPDGRLFTSGIDRYIALFDGRSHAPRRTPPLESGK